MEDRVHKYVIDILNAINEIDEATVRYGKEYSVFVSDVVFRKFIERNIEIMGEAMNLILKLYPDIKVTSARKIVDTRNFVIHSYDSLFPEILWSIVVNHLPKLKGELECILVEE